MKLRFLLLVAGLMICVPAWATTFTAASCNEADVQTAVTNAVNAAHDGDIVSIPAGTCTWTGTTRVTGSFTSSVTIQGQGAISATTGGSSTTGSDVTTIIDNINHSTGSSVSIELDTVSGKSLRVTGIALLMNASSTATNTGVLFLTGTSTAVRIDHCHFFTNAGSGMIGVQDSVNGVIDHDFFDAPSGALNTTLELRVGSSWNGDTVGHGDKSWADTDHWGSSLFIFVEDNRFHNGDIGDANADGSRYVLRYNTITIDALTGQQGLMFNHGTNPGRSRSMRAAEVYQNTFTQPGTTGVNTGTFALNGGTLLYWGNTVTQYREVVSIDYTRKNNGTYNYGSTPSNWGNCDDVSLFTAWDGPSPGYPCLDAPGRGAGDLLRGTSFPNVVNSTTGTISFAHQALSPIYIWDNTWTPAGGYSPVFLVGSQTVMAADNRDFYQQFGTNAETGSNCTTVNSCNIAVGVNQTNRAPVNGGATPDTCTAGPGGNTPGVGWWNTSNNTLWVCNPTNHWSIYYTPFTYPHPLVAGVSFTGGIAFGNVNTGSSSTLSTTLQNTTTSSASIGPFSASPSQFTVTTGSGACPSTGTLLAGATCTVYVQFSPTSAVGYSGTLTEGTSGATATLTGTGNTGVIPPTINWSPTTITFLNTAVGSNAYSLTTVLNNTGASGSTLHVALSFGGTNPGDFTCTNGTPLCGCPSTITSGSCTVTVKFSPTALGTRTATLIETDATASNNPQSVTLIGSSTCTSTSIKYPSGTNSRHTLCGSNFTEVDPASMVTNTYNPVPGNSILVMADWCAPTGCGTTTDNTTATLSDNINSPETCFVASPHSPYDFINSAVPDHNRLYAWWCPSIPSGVTTFTIATTLAGNPSTVRALSTTVAEFKSGTIVSSNFWENVDAVGSSGNTPTSTATVSTSGSTVSAEDLVPAMLVNCGGSVPATVGTGYTQILANPAADPGRVLEAQAVSTAGVKTATTTWGSYTSVCCSCDLGLGSPLDTWFGIITPLKGGIPAAGFNITGATLLNVGP